jgi:putative inorganic carbon (HCO3(-)) transporter
MEVAGASVRPFLVALLGTIAWGALAFGAVYGWAYWPLAVACALLGCWGMARSRGWREGRLRPLAWALGGVGVTIGVQLIPLPLSLFKALSPNGDRFLAQYDLRYSFQPPAWHALSVSPPATATTLVLMVAFSVFLLGLVGLLPKLPLARLATALALFGLAVAVFAILQRAAAGEARTVPIYGLWHPEQGGMPFGPFVNPNHFAGWMVLTLSLTIGYFFGLSQASWEARGRRLGAWLVWLTRPEAGRVALVGFCGLAMATSVVLSRSRSGLAALLAMLAVFGFRAIRQSSRALPKVAAVATLVAVLLGALAWGGSDALVMKFGRSSADMPGRLRAWHDALHIASDFPVFGSGLGTFGLTMLVYQTGSRDVSFTQAHNDYLQLAAEGGVLVCTAALALTAIIVSLAWHRGSRDDDPILSWIRTGAAAGLVGMAAQSTVEFSLQMPGVATLFVVLIAIAVHRPAERSPYAHRL